MLLELSDPYKRNTKTLDLFFRTMYMQKTENDLLISELLFKSEYLVGSSGLVTSFGEL